MRAPLGLFTSRYARAALFVVLLLAISACRGRAKGTVTGTVKYQGLVVPSGKVIFYGPGDESASAAIREDGSYEAKGVPVGAVRVAVVTGLAPADTQQKGAKPMKNRFGKGNPLPSSSNAVSVPAKYGDPGKSGLSLNVIEGSQQFNIDLK
jgi:hypothetical protein